MQTLSHVPLPSSQDIRYCLDSQYCSSERALLLFQVLSAVLRRAFSPKIRSIPEQLLKECSRSTVDSVTGGQQSSHPADDIRPGCTASTQEVRTTSSQLFWARFVISIRRREESVESRNISLNLQHQQPVCLRIIVSFL